MFTYQIVYRKHGCEGAADRDLVLRMIERTTVCVITAGVQCAMFVETYGKNMIQTVF